MRRLELLIHDVRFNTNNVDENRWSSIRLLKVFNDAQDTIQSLIQQANIDGRYFNRESLITLQSGTEKYDLPSDCYLENSINSVARQVTTESGQTQYYTPLRQITEKERRKEFGYAVIGTQVIISPVPRDNLVNGVRVNYTFVLPKLSIRVGQVKSLVSAIEIKLKIGFLDEDIDLFSDFITVVDRDGAIKQAAIRITDWNKSNGKIKTDTVLTNVAIDDYVVIGELGTSHSQLPREVEHLLTDFAERKIQAVDSSIDIKNADVFTEEEKNLVFNLFKKNENDTKHPPITDDTYLNF